MEEDIQDWVDAGDRYAVPFDDRDYVATAEFYERLRRLRTQIDGWLYWDEEKERVVLAKEDDWHRIKADRRAARERGNERMYGAAWPQMKVRFEQTWARIAAERREYQIAREAEANTSQIDPAQQR